MKIAIYAATLVVALAAQSALADGAYPQRSDSILLAQAAPMTEGVVRSVDRQGNTITLEHVAIKSLDLPARTSVFQVTDTKMYDQVRIGDRVRFSADRVRREYAVTKMQALR